MIDGDMCDVHWKKLNRFLYHSVDSEDHIRGLAVWTNGGWSMTGSTPAGPPPDGLPELETERG